MVFAENCTNDLSDEKKCPDVFAEDLWVHQACLDAIADTPNIITADNLHDEVMSQFDFDIDKKISSEFPTSRRGNAQMGTTMTILALCRIALKFGANIQPTTFYHQT